MAQSKALGAAHFVRMKQPCPELGARGQEIVNLTRFHELCVHFSPFWERASVLSSIFDGFSTHQKIRPKNFLDSAYSSTNR
jgi:hypothetical protein